MEFLIAHIFFGFLGWTYLLIKYRDTKKMVAIKNSDYDGAYSIAGRTIVLKTFLIILGLLLLGLIVVGIIGTIKNL